MRKPEVKVLSDRKQEFMGEVYTLDYKKGYFRNRKTIAGKFRVKILHVELYISHFGEVPYGYEVHHHDEKKSHNVIKNLYCMTKGEHTSLHNLRRGHLPEATKIKMSNSAKLRWAREREKKEQEKLKDGMNGKKEQND